LNRICRLAFLACILAAGWSPAAARAETRFEQLDVGIARAFKLGCWTGVSATARSDEPIEARLAVDAPDSEGSVVRYLGDPVQLQAGQPTSLAVMIKVGRLEGTITARLLAADRTLAVSRVRMSESGGRDVLSPRRPSVFLLARIEPNSASSAEVNRTNPFSAAERAAGAGSQGHVEVVDLASFEGLPADATAYASLDAIVLTDRFEIDAQRSRALEGWVRSGGHLVVTVAKGAESFVKSPLAGWLPVKIAAPTRLRELSALESFCRQSTRILASNDEPIGAARLSVPEGQVLISTLEGPLLVRAAWGFGRVTVLGLDFQDRRLRQWSGLGELVRRMLGFSDHAKRAQATESRLTQTGITELGTQLDFVQDDFPAVGRLTTWSVMGLLAVLVLVIGPLDFVVVHKLFKRPELTWITFPLIAVVAAGLAVYWGTSVKGDRLLLNQLDVLDADAASGWVNARSLAIVYSPEHRRYDLAAGAEGSTLTPRPAGTALRTSWHGKAESSFGGMYRAGGADIARPGYSIAAEGCAIDDVPIGVWSTRSFEAESHGQERPLAESRLESRGPGHLGGTFLHHLPEPIEDWIVAYGHTVFFRRPDPGSGKTVEIAPGVPWSLQTASQRELSGYLTGAHQKAVKSVTSKLDELRIEHADYDPLNRDPLDVFRMISFHESAGGTSYTGLGNGVLRRLDCSPLLDLNRAVLVGRIRRRAIDWSADGRTLEPEGSVTFVRLVLPVKPLRGS
jgi:hypothetical protein